MKFADINYLNRKEIGTIFRPPISRRNDAKRVLPFGGLDLVQLWAHPAINKFERRILIVR